MAEKLTTGQSLRLAFKSWRVGSVTLLSFPSGLPLGIVLITIPYWAQQTGIDIKTIGLITAAQVPYAFKFLWSPLIDRYAPRWGRKRFWILLSQVALTVAFLWVARVAEHPAVSLVALVTLIASFLSASQDIAFDAYSVEVLRREELGLAVGARAALARAGVFMARFVNTLGPKNGWRSVFMMVSAMFLPFMGVTVAGPEPEIPIAPPQSLRAAVWEPFVGFFRHPRALEIAAFLILFKYADNLATSLISPFFGQMGYPSEDVGLAQGVIGLACSILGTIAGGILVTPLGLGRALWIFGILQALGNLGYAFVAHLGGPSVDVLHLGGVVLRPAMYTSVALEALTMGMGTGAFSVFLMRLTQRQFSATQYALFSSLFALGRTLAGPPAGAMADALGWTSFFMLTPVVALPGLFLLHRFAPWGAKDITGLPDETTETPEALGKPVTFGGLVARAIAGGFVATAFGYAVSILLAALKASRGNAAFDLVGAAARVAHPARAVDYVDLVGPPVLGLVAVVATAAYVVARRGFARR